MALIKIIMCGCGMERLDGGTEDFSAHWCFLRKCPREGVMMPRCVIQSHSVKQRAGQDGVHANGERLRDLTFERPNSVPFFWSEGEEEVSYY